MIGSSRVPVAVEGQRSGVQVGSTACRHQGVAPCIDSAAQRARADSRFLTLSIEGEWHHGAPDGLRQWVSLLLSLAPAVRRAAQWVGSPLLTVRWVQVDTVRMACM